MNSTEKIFRHGEKTWRVIDKVGSGGQGTVFRVVERSWEASLESRLGHIGGLVQQLARKKTGFGPKDSSAAELVQQIGGAAVQMSTPARYGALKQFRIPKTGPEAVKARGRFEREVEALTSLKSHPGILKLLDAHVAGRWMVTEYHPNGTLHIHLDRFRGDLLAALEAYRLLVDATAAIHAMGAIHRDIKPENTFVATDGRLVLGDFGIVFFEDAKRNRLTSTFENVGSRDWMPAWAFGMRVEDLRPSFDVSCLGKVLWAMLSGKEKLRLWYHRDNGNNLQTLFPDRPEMQFALDILDRTVVEKELACLPTAKELLGIVDTVLGALRRSGQVLREGVPRPCRVCGRGKYEPRPAENRHLLALDDAHKRQGQIYEQGYTVRLFACDFCGHIQLFHHADGKVPPAWSSS